MAELPCLSSRAHSRTMVQHMYELKNIKRDRSRQKSHYFQVLALADLQLQYLGLPPAEKRSSKGSLSGAEDGNSVASTSTLASIQDLPSTSGGEDPDFVDQFERCLEALYEKRCVMTLRKE